MFTRPRSTLYIPDGIGSSLSSLRLPPLQVSQTVSEKPESDKDFSLRKGQVPVRDALFEAISSGMKKGYVIMPMGAGKSPIFLQIPKYFDDSTLILAPSGPVLRKTHQDAQKFCPGASVKHARGIGATGPLPEIAISSYHYFLSSMERGDRQWFRFKRIILDDGHVCLTDRRIEAVRALMDRGAEVWGFSGSEGYSEYKHLRRLLQNKIYHMTHIEAVEARLIKPQRVFPVETRVDLSGVRLLDSGQYHRGDLDDVLSDKAFNHSVAELAKNCCSDHSLIAFAAGRTHARNLADAFCKIGIEARAITGDESKDAQAKKLELFENRHIRVLVSAKLLTLGYHTAHTTVVFDTAPSFSINEVGQRGGRVGALIPDSPDQIGYVFSFLHPDPRKRARQVTYADVISDVELLPKGWHQNPGTVSAGRQVKPPPENISGLRVSMEVNQSRDIFSRHKQSVESDTLRFEEAIRQIKNLLAKHRRLVLSTEVARQKLSPKRKRSENNQESPREETQPSLKRKYTSVLTGLRDGKLTIPQGEAMLDGYARELWQRMRQAFPGRPHLPKVEAVYQTVLNHIAEIQSHVDFLKNAPNVRNIPSKDGAFLSQNPKDRVGQFRARSPAMRAEIETRLARINELEMLLSRPWEAALELGRELKASEQEATRLKRNDLLRAAAPFVNEICSEISENPADLIAPAFLALSEFIDRPAPWHSQIGFYGSSTRHIREVVTRSKRVQAWNGASLGENDQAQNLVGRVSEKDLKKGQKMVEIFLKKHGLSPSPKKLSNILRIGRAKTKNILEALDVTKTPISIERDELKEPLISKSHFGSTFGLGNEMMKAIYRLEAKRGKILVLRYGLLDGETKTYEEAGKLLNITRERARQLESHAIRQLSYLASFGLIGDRSNNYDVTADKIKLRASLNSLDPAPSTHCRPTYALQSAVDGESRDEFSPEQILEQFRNAMHLVGVKAIEFKNGYFAGFASDHLAPTSVLYKLAAVEDAANDLINIVQTRAPLDALPAFKELWRIILRTVPGNSLPYYGLSMTEENRYLLNSLEVKVFQCLADLKEKTIDWINLNYI